MVKVRIVCPCFSSSSAHGRPNRRTMSNPNMLLLSGGGAGGPLGSGNYHGHGGQGGGGISIAGYHLSKFVSFTLFLFVITTYMVLSLDTLILMEGEAQQQQQQQQLDQLQQASGGPVPRRNLANPLPHQRLDTIKLIVLDELPSGGGGGGAPSPLPVSTTRRPAKSHKAKPVVASVAASATTATTEEDFASSLSTISQALLQQAPASPSSPAATAGSDDDEEEGGDGNASGGSGSSNAGGDDGGISWKRIHLCTREATTTGMQLNHAHWIGRHRKYAILSDGYTKTPTEARMRHLKASLTALNRAADSKAAAYEANRADYTLCRMELGGGGDSSEGGGGGRIVAWLPRVKGDAQVFVRFGGEQPPRPLAIEIPHSMYDHTLAQGLHVFTETRARALVLSTSHRCSRALANACTGNENEPIRNVCSSSSAGAGSLAATAGSSAPSHTNRNSDTAHAVQTMFHAAHEQLADDFPALVFASLHSTKASQFVISDGTSLPQPADAAIWRLARKLGRSLQDTVISVCNEGDAAAHGGTSLLNVRRVLQERSFICGATNVQGRHLNGGGGGGGAAAAVDACRAKIPRSGEGLVPSGRFLHIEQPVSFVLPLASNHTAAAAAAGGDSRRPVLTKQLSDALVFAIAAQTTTINNNNGDQVTISDSIFNGGGGESATDSADEAEDRYGPAAVV